MQGQEGKQRCKSLSPKEGAMKQLTKILINCVFLWSLLALQLALADEGNISRTDKYAWSESTGWTDFRPTHGGVTVHDTYLSGYAWSGNIGWIKLGNDSGGPYQNTGSGNWGVNADPDGNLSGYAWSEAWGWISFKTPHSQVRIGPEGHFEGYAWSQNVGWIHFGSPSSTYNVRKINIAPILTASAPEITDLTDDDADNSGIAVSDILSGTVTDVGNGALEGLAIYSADSGEGGWQYSLDNGETWDLVGDASQSSALLLGAEDRIRFVPDGAGADQASFSFYAWDQTSGERGETADVTVRGDAAAFSSTGDTATVIVVLVIDISGQVTYYSTRAPMSDILLTLAGADGVSHTAHTNENGDFVFFHVPPGEYTLTPSKDADSGDMTGLSATDASKIARYVIGKNELDTYQGLAADVTGNGTVSGTDASDLARYAAELAESLNNEDHHWRFVPTSSDSLTESPVLFVEQDIDHYDFVGIRIGDVSGNYSAGQRDQISPRDAGTPGVSLGTSAGETLSVPVVLEGGANIEGIDIRMSYNPDALELSDVTLADSVLEYEDYELTVNTDVPGQISLALFASEDLFTGSGTILHVSFHVVGMGDGPVLEFASFEYNETAVSDGHDNYRDSARIIGGFFVDGELSQRLSISQIADDSEEVHLPEDYDPDLNDDGKINATDAIIALQRGYLEAAIGTLQTLVGF